MTSTTDDLLEARQAYLRDVSPCYDEALDSVIEAVAASSSIGKADIGALAFWKRVRVNPKSAAKLHAMSDKEVREVTASAVAAVRNTDLLRPESARRGRSALTPLPGFRGGDAMASALLLAAAPERMAVYDRRAQKGLEMLGKSLTSSPGRYERYITLIDELLVELKDAGQGWTPRDVDTALYTLGKSSKPMRA